MCQVFRKVSEKTFNTAFTGLSQCPVGDESSRTGALTKSHKLAGYWHNFSLPVCALPVSVNYPVHNLCQYYYSSVTMFLTWQHSEHFCTIFHSPAIMAGNPLVSSRALHYLYGSFLSFVFHLSVTCALFLCFPFYSWRLLHGLLRGQFFYSFSPCTFSVFCHHFYILSWSHVIHSPHLIIGDLLTQHLAYLLPPNLRVNACAWRFPSALHTLLPSLVKMTWSFHRFLILLIFLHHCQPPLFATFFTKSFLQLSLSY